jgi:mono/diheme cytochrome c family protein
MDGSGGGTYGGVAASFVKTQLNHDELVQVIADGRLKKGMPAWKGVLNPTEIDAMATYIEHKFKSKGAPAPAN